MQAAEKIFHMMQTLYTRPSDWDTLGKTRFNAYSFTTAYKETNTSRYNFNYQVANRKKRLNLAQLFSLILSSLGTQHPLLSLIITLLFLCSHYHHHLFIPSSLSSHFLFLISFYTCIIIFILFFLCYHHSLFPSSFHCFITIIISLNYHPSLLILSSSLFPSFSSFHCIITIITISLHYHPSLLTSSLSSPYFHSPSLSHLFSLSYHHLYNSVARTKIIKVLYLSVAVCDLPYLSVIYLYSIYSISSISYLSGSLSIPSLSL